MTQQIGGVPYFEIAFDELGRLRQGGDLPEVVKTGGIRDLFVFSHGWNTSDRDASDLYSAMFALIAGMLPAEQSANAGFVGVHWPSLLFPEDAPAATGPLSAQPSSPHGLGAFASPQPGGAAANMSTGADLANALAPAFPGQEPQLERIGRLLDEQPQDPDRLIEFHRLVNGLVTTACNAPEDAGEAAVLKSPTSRVFDTMAALAPAVDGHTEAFDPFRKLWRGARETLRVASYYEMKERAGVIGRDGLGPLLGRVAEANPGVRAHLSGHSFGARLVSFSLQGLPAGQHGANSPVKSLYLVQGAFSHFCFAPQAPVANGTGALAQYVGRVDGPLLSTFTAADRAVGWWYPNASRLAWQDSAGLEEINYRWGAMGHDGYQQADAHDLRMAEVGADYGFQAGTFYRLDANHVINHSLDWFSQAHSDIRHPQVAWAAVSAARPK